MPAIIDHDERRREVCDIAARLIARSGIEGVTVRDVASEANCSTRIVSHYFKNKRELMLLTYREYSHRNLLMAETALNDGKGLLGTLQTLLPLDECGRLNWQIWIAFWGKTSSDPEFVEAQVERGRQVHELIKRALEQELGNDVPEAFDWDHEADRLLTVLVGIATLATFDPEIWPLERQTKMLAEEIEIVSARSWS